MTRKPIEKKFIYQIALFMVFFIGCYVASPIFHESGHALACDNLSVKIFNITITGFGRNAVTRQNTGSPLLEGIIGFSGGALATVAFSAIYLIMEDTDVLVRINLLGFSLSHFQVAFIEGFARNWYRANNLLISQGSLFISLIIAGIFEYFQEKKKSLQ